jgi:hypothetical protein
MTLISERDETEGDIIGGQIGIRVTQIKFLEIIERQITIQVFQKCNCRIKLFMRPNHLIRGAKGRGENEPYGLLDGLY